MPENSSTLPDGGMPVSTSARRGRPRAGAQPCDCCIVVAVAPEARAAIVQARHHVL